MAGKLNAEWHRHNRMPKNPSLDDRVRWHLAHAGACGCREMPASIAAAIRAARRTASTSNSAPDLPASRRRVT